MDDDDTTRTRISGVYPIELIGGRPRGAWTIKRMFSDTQKRATDAARANDQSVAEWLDEAITARLDQQRGNLIIPPGHQQTEAEAPPPAPAPSILAADLSGLARLTEAARAAFLDADADVPLSLAREAATTARAYARAVRGKPTGKPKHEKGKPGIAVYLPTATEAADHE